MNTNVSACAFGDRSVSLCEVLVKFAGFASATLPKLCGAAALGAVALGMGMLTCSSLPRAVTDASHTDGCFAAHTSDAVASIPS